MQRKASPGPGRRSGCSRRWRGSSAVVARLLKSAKETLLRAGVFAFRDRRAKKRDFRRLFITRLSAAAEMRGLRYSRLIHGLRLADIGLDRKSLSDLAIFDAETFDAIIDKVRAELDKFDAALKARPKSA